MFNVKELKEKITQYERVVSYEDPDLNEWAKGYLAALKDTLEAIEND